MLARDIFEDAHNMESRAVGPYQRSPRFTRRLPFPPYLTLTDGLCWKLPAMVRLSMLSSALVRFALLWSMAIAGIHSNIVKRPGSSDLQTTGQDEARARESESSCEHYIAKHSGHDDVHWYTFYLAERDGWPLERCTRELSRRWEHVIDLLGVVPMGTNVYAPVPMPAQRLCAIQARSPRSILIPMALKCSHLSQKVPKCLRKAPSFLSLAPPVLPLPSLALSRC